MNETFPTVLKDKTGHVLVVEDEEMNRELLRDLLEGQGHQVTEAENGEQGLQKVKENPPDVILLDVMMPGMDGFEVCRRLKADPETAPIPVLLVTALTERSDRLTGIEAGANDVISKPVDIEDVILRVRNAVYTMRLFREVQENYKRVRKLEMEKGELLEKTLHGAVKVLTEILSMVNPSAFGRASRLRSCVGHIATYLDLPGVWEFELAAMLSQIGCVSLPIKFLDKVYDGEPLTDSEYKLFSEHSKISSNLLRSIPRLENIADMIKAQQLPFRRQHKGNNLQAEDRIALGGLLLKASLEFDYLLAQNLPAKVLLKRLRQQIGDEVPGILDALEYFEVQMNRKVVKPLRVNELDRSMILDEDVFATDGLLLVSRGQEVTFPVLARLRNYAQGIGVVQPFRVIVQAPASESPKA